MLKPKTLKCRSCGMYNVLQPYAGCFSQLALRVLLYLVCFFREGKRKI